MKNHNRKSRRIKSSTKTLALLLSVVLIMGAVIGGSLAYLQTNSTSITNSFTPGHVGCEVKNTADGFVVAPDSDTNTPVKLRAAIVANWVDGDGNVYWQQPQVTVTGDKWAVNNTDGFYYYSENVVPKGAAEPLTVSLNQGQVAPSASYNLQIQVLGEAIQAEPAAAPAVWTNGG